MLKTASDGTGSVWLSSSASYDTENVKPMLLPQKCSRDGILPSISFITFFVVSFVTVVTVRKLKTAMDWRQKTSSHVIDKRQMTLVKMLVSVSCVYIACNAPNLSLAIARVIDGFETLDTLEKVPVNERTYKPETDIRLRTVTIHANPLAG
ncbi:hypothetical protein ACOMHN_021850 [Nucella lapillus]